MHLEQPETERTEEALPYQPPGIQGLLRSAYRRHGRLRTNLFLGIAGFFLLGLLYAEVCLRWLIWPALAAGLPADAETWSILHAAELRLVFAAMVITAAATFALYHLLLLPFEQARREFRRRPVASPALEKIMALSTLSDRRAALLDAALTDNEELRNQLEQTSASARAQSLALEGLLGIATDAIVLVDREDRVIDLTASAATLVGWHRSSAAGRPFDAVVQLFDQSKDHPLEYPLPSLAHRAQESGSLLPRLENAILLSQAREQQRVLASVCAVQGSDGKPNGALVRLSIAEVKTARPSPVPGNAIAEPAQSMAPMVDAVTGLGLRDAFDRRLDELLEQARAQHVTHTLAFIRFDNLGTINDTHGFFAGEQLLWTAGSILREAVGSEGDGYRVSTGRFAILFARPPRDALPVIERFRDQLSARELVWDNVRFATTVCVAVLPLDQTSEGRKTLIDLAERELIEARKAGGNLVRSYAPDTTLVERRRIDGSWADWLLPRLDNGLA
ncbi:MAG TPA: GGDEF domain-containing protein, partial [Nevskiaceae bacterium]|nr:GGDEF domain-containing protein [Nevskiaceae bacterium]